MIKITYIVTSVYGLPTIVFLGIRIIKIQTIYIVVSLGRVTVDGSWSEGITRLLHFSKELQTIQK
jgi:hypothetical protein